MLSIIGAGNETFLYVNELACNKEIHLNPSVTLLPSTSSFNFEVASKLVRSDIDFSIIVLLSKKKKYINSDFIFVMLFINKNILFYILNYINCVAILY